MRIQVRLEHLVELARGQRADVVGDAESQKIVQECLTGVAVPDDMRDAVLATHGHEALDGGPRIVRARAALIQDMREHGSAVRIAIRDAERRIVTTAAAHIREAEKLDPTLRLPNAHAARDGVHDHFGAEG